MDCIRFRLTTDRKAVAYTAGEDLFAILSGSPVWTAFVFGLQLIAKPYTAEEDLFAILSGSPVWTAFVFGIASDHKPVLGRRKINCDLEEGK